MLELKSTGFRYWVETRSALRCGICADLEEYYLHFDAVNGRCYFSSFSGISVCGRIRLSFNDSWERMCVWVRGGRYKFYR